MNFVFSKWLTRQHSFFGTYERKVSVMALCKIFLHGINTQDQRLLNVTVKDLVELPTSATKVRTRSQAAHTQVIFVPIMVKIFKLLISELTNLREVKNALSNTLDSDDDDDDTENSAYEGIDGGKNFTAHMLFDDGESCQFCCVFYFIFIL
jgi:hypothetical protein